MGAILMWMLIIFLIPSLAIAKDLGVHGHLFEIAEPDLLLQIEKKLTLMQESGELKQHQEKLLYAAQEKIETPTPVKGITYAVKTRTFTYDPTITVPYDLKDHEGRVFQKAGTRVNPLEIKPLTKDLVFFDGTDEEQIQWIEEHYIKDAKPAKLILVNGNPFTLIKQWNVGVYFDQRGRLVEKLGIQSVPAFVRQEANLLKITEVCLDH